LKLHYAIGNSVESLSPDHPIVQTGSDEEKIRWAINKVLNKLGTPLINKISGAFIEVPKRSLDVSNGSLTEQLFWDPFQANFVAPDILLSNLLEQLKTMEEGKEFFHRNPLNGEFQSFAQVLTSLRDYVFNPKYGIGMNNARLNPGKYFLVPPIKLTAGPTLQMKIRVKGLYKRSVSGRRGYTSRTKSIVSDSLELAEEAVRELSTDHIIVGAVLEARDNSSGLQAKYYWEPFSQKFAPADVVAERIVETLDTFGRSVEAGGEDQFIDPLSGEMLPFSEFSKTILGFAYMRDFGVGSLAIQDYMAQSDDKSDWVLPPVVGGNFITPHRRAGPSLN